MKKLLTAVFLSVFALSSTYAATFYNAKDLEKFEQTNQCSGCDLSSAIIT